MSNFSPGFQMIDIIGDEHGSDVIFGKIEKQARLSLIAPRTYFQQVTGQAPH